MPIPRNSGTRDDTMSGGRSTYVPKTKIERWFDARLPLPRLVYDQFIVYPVPRNLNYAYSFGGILTMMLASQIVTGVVLAMHYAADTTLAFNSVEKIMRDVNSGWLLRYLHSNGASFFFIAVYIHISRGLYYGSYKAPRELLWVLGCTNLLLMMAIAFMGYVLPWGQMSFWGATVITGFFTAIPLVGDWIQQLLLGGFAVDNPTLNRFFALHYLLPFMLAGVVILHIWALHVVGQNNPAGIDVKSKTDVVDFTPHATIKDVFGAVIFLLVFAYFVFYMPNYLGHPDNYTAADPLKTPAHIVPEWYFLPFYAILRAVTFNIGPIDSKLGGVLAMFGAIAVLFFVPWLDTSKVRSAVYRPWYRRLLLAVRRQRHLPRLAGLQAGGGLVHPRHAGVDPLLFRVLHRRHAAAWPDRDAASAAELDNRSSPREEQARAAVRRTKPRMARRRDRRRSDHVVKTEKRRQDYAPRPPWSRLSASSKVAGRDGAGSGSGHELVDRLPCLHCAGRPGRHCRLARHSAAFLDYAADRSDCLFPRDVGPAPGRSRRPVRARPMATRQPPRRYSSERQKCCGGFTWHGR